MIHDDALTHNGDEPGALPTETGAAIISCASMLEAGSIGPVGYIVSAYVAGPSLEQWLRHNHGRVSPGWGAQDRSQPPITPAPSPSGGPNRHADVSQLGGASLYDSLATVARGCGSSLNSVRIAA